MIQTYSAWSPGRHLAAYLEKETRRRQRDEHPIRRRRKKGQKSRVNPRVTKQKPQRREKRTLRWSLDIPLTDEKAALGKKSSGGHELHGDNLRKRNRNRGIDSASAHPSDSVRYFSYSITDVGIKTLFSALTFPLKICTPIKKIIISTLFPNGGIY